MKRFYRLAWLALMMGLFIACSSPSTEDSVVEVAEQEEVVKEEANDPAVDAEPEEEAEPEPVEVSESEPEPELEEEGASEEDDSGEEEEVNVVAVDGPTHTPAATIDEAIVERAYDQAKGAEEPLLTIIEYGDFQ